MAASSGDGIPAQLAALLGHPVKRIQITDETPPRISVIGVATAIGRGDTHIIAFYDNGIQPVPVCRPISDKLSDTYPEVAATSEVDQLIMAKLRPLGIVPSEKCTEEEFLRRVSLDLTGSLPLPSEIRSFVASKSPVKRSKKIGYLLKRPAYASWWTTKLCNYAGNYAQNLNYPVFRNDMARQWYD